MRNLTQWVAGERAEILARRAALETGFATLPGWRLIGCGAFFGYAEHPFDMASPELAKRLVRDAGVLLLPGTMFRPKDDPRGAREVRIAFANIGVPAIRELVGRLAAFRP
jgi:aspartate/methionine/tyrosine aminotransferase